MSKNQSRSYAQTYKAHPLIRWLLYCATPLYLWAYFGPSLIGKSSSFIIFNDLHLTSRNYIYAVVLIFLTLHVLRLRVILSPDAIEIRGILSAKKYQRSDIKSRGHGVFSLQSTGDKVFIPTLIHSDANYRNWFKTLPYDKNLTNEIPTKFLPLVFIALLLGGNRVVLQQFTQTVFKNKSTSFRVKIAGGLLVLSLAVVLLVLCVSHH